MKRESDRFAEFVDHPRYGRRPRITGLNPHPHDCGVHLHWNATTHQEIVSQYEAVIGKWPHGDLGGRSDRTKRIPNTAVPADLTRQSNATVPVTHYFDLERICRDCGRPFIFFASEQKHWYETLRFPLEADAIRCPMCRKQNQALGKARATYERLQKLKNRTDTDTVRLTESLLTLVENSIFNARQTEHARALIKTLPDELRAAFLKRIRQIEETTRTAHDRSNHTVAPRRRGATSG
jgi:hypothetical protein